MNVKMIVLQLVTDMESLQRCTFVVQFICVIIVSELGRVKQTQLNKKVKRLID